MKQKRSKFLNVVPLIAAFSIATIAYANDGSCTPGYPRCPTPTPENGQQCGSSGNPGTIEVDYSGPYEVYACTGKSALCSPSGAQCNILTVYRTDMGIEYHCGDGPKVFCIPGLLGSGVSTGRNCSGVICGPSPLPMPPEFTPPCNLCVWEVFPIPPSDGSPD